MTNFDNTPLQNAFEVTLEGSISSTDTSMTLSTAPGFTLPAGKGVYAVIDPKNSYREVVRITAITGAVCTVERGKPDYDGGASTAVSHSGGATVIITNTYQIYDELADAVNSKVDASTGQVTAYANATARDAAITSPDEGMQVYLSSEGYFTDYVGGAWVERATGSVTPNADETTAGKVELATAAEVAAGDTTGGTGARLVIPTTVVTEVSAGATDAGKIPRLNASGALDVSVLSGFDTIDNRDNSYTPAYVTSGANVFSTFNVWEGTTDGSFQVTIDGTLRSITGIDFTGVASMAEVASRIQTAIRAVTSGLETVVWSSGAGTMVINSGDNTSSSSITVLTAGVSGTDISGAGVDNYLDMDVGNGVVTNTALNIVGDAGKLVAIDTDGYINSGLYKPPVPVVRTYTSTSVQIGEYSTRFDITNPSGTTFRYTYDGSGTDPGITAISVPTGAVLEIYGGNFHSGNNGVFTVTASAANYFEVTNAAGVAENDKTLATGYIAKRVPATWSKPSGLSYIEIEGVSGGGAGAGVTGDGDAGGGGGGGGYFKATRAEADLGATESVIVGAGGVQNSAYSTGSQGSMTVFGSYYSATGGAGGTNNQEGGVGGVATGGDVNISGQKGGGGLSPSGIAGNSYGGAGGDSDLGHGDPGGVEASGGNGGLYGGGGSGAGTNSSAGNRTGGNGANGIIIVTEYY